MSEFRIHTKDSAPEAVLETLAKVESAYGFVPNLLATMAEAPALANGYFALASLFEQTTLTPVQRQVVLLAASRENECEYCMAAHTAGAHGARVPADVVEGLREGRELADPKLEALRRFTTAVVGKRGWVEDREVDAFLRAGYTRAQVLEVILGVGLKTLTNYTNHIAKTPLDREFEPVRWRKGVNR